jgi:hypothetical protein
MSESSLSVNRTTILQRMGMLLRYGDDPTVWLTDTSKATRAGWFLDTALSNFYKPAPLPGESQGHIWSFLTPLMHLGVSEGVISYQLDDDWGGFVNSSELSFTGDDNWYGPVKLVGIGEILRRRQGVSVALDVTGPPQFAATVALPSDGTAGQRTSLEIWPTPDGPYTITGQYYSLPDQITSSKPYPLGGQPHGQTLIASALAVAELELLNAPGPRAIEFTRQLIASVSYDRRVIASAKNLGYNGDRTLSADTDRRRYGSITVGEYTI